MYKKEQRLQRPHKEYRHSKNSSEKSLNKQLQPKTSKGGEKLKKEKNVNFRTTVNYLHAQL